MIGNYIISMTLNSKIKKTNILFVLSNGSVVTSKKVLTQAHNSLCDFSTTDVYNSSGWIDQKDSKNSVYDTKSKQINNFRNRFLKYK